MRNGDRVHTPHGPGTVVDECEMARSSWPGSPQPLQIATGRIGVNLDDGHTWAIKGKTAYYQPNELEPE